MAALAALVVAVGGPSLAGAAERPVVPGAPPMLGEAVAVGRAAVVTLKIPGTASVHGRRVDHWSEPDELGDEPDDGDAGDFTIGSAVMLDASGIAVTTARVARRAPVLQALTSDGRRLRATIVARDEVTDLAVLSVCCDARPLGAIPLGDSDHVRAGDWVVAIGAPFGLDESVTASVVAAVTAADADGLGGLIQTGGSVTAGYAGGPLLDARGAMIGLVVGHGAGTGLALPSNTVRRIVAALLERGRVPRGWLGATAQPLDAELARALGAREAAGVVVVDVRRDSPAARAGLRPGDIVRALDGRRFDSATRMAATIAGLPPGRPVTLHVWRRAGEIVLVVPLGEEPDEDAVRARTKARLGIQVRTLTADVGVVVSAVPSDGAAARAGVRSGDVVRELNGRTTPSMAEFEAALEALTDGTRVVMLLQRGAASSYVTFAP